MSNMIIKIFLGVFSILIVKEYMEIFLCKKRDLNKKLFWTSTLFFSVLLESSSVIPIFNFIINFIFILLVAFYGYVGKKSEKIIITFSLIVIWMISELIIGYVAMIFHIYFVLPQIQGSILSKMVTFFFVVVIKNHMKGYLQDEKK